MGAAWALAANAMLGEGCLRSRRECKDRRGLLAPSKRPETSEGAACALTANAMLGEGCLPPSKRPETSEGAACALTANAMLGEGCLRPRSERSERRGWDSNPRGSSPTRSPSERTRPDYATSPVNGYLRPDTRQDYTTVRIDLISISPARGAPLISADFPKEIVNKLDGIGEFLQWT